MNKKNTKHKPKSPKMKIPKSFSDKGYLTVKVQLDKKRYQKISFGKIGNPESITLYKIFIADYVVPPQEATQKWIMTTTKNKTTLINHTLNAPNETPKYTISLGELIVKFLDEKKPRNKTKPKYDPDYNHYKRTAQLLIDNFTEVIPAYRITRQELLRFRDIFNEIPSKRTGKKPSRQYVNKTLAYVKTIFRWGANKGFLPTSIISELECTEPLAYNKGNRETEPRQEVADEIIKMTLPLLLPTLRTMIQILRLCGTRPSEICRIKIGDIDTESRKTDNVWIVWLKKHKTARYGKIKTIVLNKAAQELIKLLAINSGNQINNFFHKSNNKEGGSRFSVGLFVLGRRVASANQNTDYIQPHL
ncbi:MAG: site-specific integrase [Planctomycetaceae bacterium]|jgi:integrase|nr:site-specific integrase [Planctomycetaceae bacterium]